MVVESGLWKKWKISFEILISLNASSRSINIFRQTSEKVVVFLPKSKLTDKPEESRKQKDIFIHKIRHTNKQNHLN